MTNNTSDQRSYAALTIRIAMVVVTAVIVALIASSALASPPTTTTQGAPAEVAPPHELAPYQDYSVTREGSNIDSSGLWLTMNEAMQTGDREAFLSHAIGDARTHLARWWDGTKTIGWETGYIDPVAEVTQEMQVLLGVDFTFSASPLRGSGDDEAGLKLLHGMRYNITTVGGEDDLMIASITPVSPMPWDDGEIYAVKTDHVVHYGLADERDLVNATVDEAERAAVIALDAVRSLGGEVPQNGFISGITDSAERMSRWWGASKEHDDFHAAGFMRATSRPAKQASHIDSIVATGRGSSGGTSMAGPLSSDQRLETLVHEFAHILHYTAVPETFLFRNTAATEGFAQYVEYVSGLGVAPLDRPEVREAIATEGIEAISTENLRSGDAWIAYAAAASYYQFVAENGGDPWELAIEAKANTSRMDTAAIRQDPSFTVEGWQAWAAG